MNSPHHTIDVLSCGGNLLPVRADRLPDLVHREDVRDREPERLDGKVAARALAPPEAKCGDGWVSYVGVGRAVGVQEAVGVERRGLGVDGFVVQDCPERIPSLRVTASMRDGTKGLTTRCL